VDQPTRLSLASASSAAVKPGPSNEVRLPYYAIIHRDLHQQPYDHKLQLPYLRGLRLDADHDAGRPDLGILCVHEPGG
jgi:hypothetical protein